MSKFDQHFCMTEPDAIEYIREKMPEYFGDSPLTCKEIGDGNINYVFRIKAEDTGKSIIIKHADKFFRRSRSAKSIDNNAFEAKVLKIEAMYAPDQVPKIYFEDPVMACVVMQDIGDHENMRYAMIAHETFPTLAEDISTFMAETLINTSDLVMHPDQKKTWTKEFMNLPMCEISERLVLEEPFKNAKGSNRVFEPNREFLERELYEDEKLHYEVAILKYYFQNKAQSLIHGDLHSGSIFVKPYSTMVLDPEFAFYGPAGYDVGNVIAHLVFAWANAEVTEPDAEKKEAFQKWVEETIVKTVDLFYEKSMKIIDEKGKDVMFSTLGFPEWFLQDVMNDTAGFCGTEIIRRVIGSAKVKDIECIEDPAARCRMEQISVLTAKDCILHAKEFHVGKAYVDAIHRAAEKAVQL